jgi:hypothetical protein
MEKRRKIVGIDASNGYDAEITAATDDDIKKARSMSSYSIFCSLLIFLVVLYGLYAVYSDKTIANSLVSINIPSIREESSLILSKMVHQTEPSLKSFNPLQLSEETESQTSEISEEELQNNVNVLLEQIREIKSSGRAIETDPEAKLLVSSVQDELRKLIPMRYGPGPYFLEMKLKFPKTMADYAEEGADGMIIIQLGPIELVPYSIYYVMEVARQWQGGAFHRRAGHVLQAMVNTRGKDIRSLAFQEYHPDFPHRKLTLGYAGR